MAGADPVVILGLTEGGITAEQKLVDLLPPLVAPTAATEHNTIRTPLVPFACWRAHDMRFEFASSFVLPSISPEIRSLKELIDRRTLTNDKGELTDKPVLSVFGHADPVGDDNFNKQLSGRRAQAIYGMLVRNV